MGWFFLIHKLKMFNKFVFAALCCDNKGRFAVIIILLRRLVFFLIKFVIFVLLVSLVFHWQASYLYGACFFNTQNSAY